MRFKIDLRAHLLCSHQQGGERQSACPGRGGGRGAGPQGSPPGLRRVPRTGPARGPHLRAVGGVLEVTPRRPRDLEATLPEDAQGTESWGRFFPARAVGFWGERGSPASASTGASRPHRDPPSLFLAAQACPEGQLFGQPRVDTKHLMYTRPPWVGPPPPRVVNSCYLLLAHWVPDRGDLGLPPPLPPHAPCQALPSHAPRVPPRRQRLQFPSLIFSLGMAGRGAFSYSEAAHARRGAQADGGGPSPHAHVHARRSPWSLSPRPQAAVRPAGHAWRLPSPLLHRRASRGPDAATLDVRSRTLLPLLVVPTCAWGRK